MINTFLSDNSQKIQFQTRNTSRILKFGLLKVKPIACSVKVTVYNFIYKWWNSPSVALHCDTGGCMGGRRRLIMGELKGEGAKNCEDYSFSLIHCDRWRVKIYKANLFWNCLMKIRKHYL